MSDIIIKDIPLLLKEISEKNSEHAMKILYRNYFNKLLRFVTLYVKSDQAGEEIIGDVFLEIWQNRASLLEIKNFNAYIFTVSRNKSIDYLRSNKLYFDQLDENSLDLYSKTETTPEDYLISKELTNKLNIAIESLPSQCKMAFKLIREDNLKYKEAAEVLNISVKTLEAHITKAVKVLRCAITSIA